MAFRWPKNGLYNDVFVTVNDEKVRLNDLLTYDTETAARLHELDRVHTYGSFYIADLKV